MEIINTNQKELRIGQKTINKQGLLVEIIEYKDANNIVVDNKLINIFYNIIHYLSPFL